MWLSRFWQFLTEPPEEVESVETRRRMRFLSALLVIVIPLGFVGNIISHLVTSPSIPVFQSPGFVTILSASGVLTVAYFLGRTEKYYLAGATLTLFMITLTSAAAAVFDPPEAESLLVFLALDVLLASLLLPWRGTILVAVANVAVAAFLPLFATSLTLSSLTNVLIFLSIMSVLILASARIRQQDLDRIEGQARRLADMVAHAEQQAQELKRINNRIEAILNSVGEGLVVVALDGRIEQVNPAFEMQTGYATLEIIRRHHDELLLGSTIPPETEKAYYAAMDAGEVWRGEIPVQRKDGTVFDAAVTISPVRSHKEELIAYAVSVRDITVQKEVERLKNAFVSNVSHELRTPLSNLKIYLSLLKQAEPHELEDYVETLRRETNRLHHIVEDLLRLSRLEQGRAELAFREVYLNSLVGQYVADRASLALEKGIELVLSQQAEAPVVSADENMVGQVLSILLTNAINYSGPGGQVKVATHVRKTDKERWCGFSVTDRGPGISPEEQSHLFERFFRGKAASESGAPGTGLGLAIAKEIVELHGGQIDVKSEGVPGKGAAFFVWLPNNGMQT